MHRMKHVLSTLVIGFSLVLFVSNAQAVPFTNGSFEVGTNPGASFITLATGSTAITGWTVTGGNVDYIGGLWDASDGSRSIDMNGNSPGAISQTFDTTAGIQYDVQFDLAANTGGGSTIKTLQVAAASDSGVFTFDMTGHSFPSNMGYETNNFLFTALASTTTLTFTSLSTAVCCFGPVLDNVQVAAVAAPVPEPSTMILLGSGLVGLVGFNYKRKNKTS